MGLFYTGKLVISTDRSSQWCNAELQIEEDERQNHLIGRGPHDADIGDGIQEPLRVDGDVVGDLSGSVLRSRLARKLERFPEDGRHQRVADVDGKDVELQWYQPAKMALCQYWQT